MSTPERLQANPDIPTMTEQGVPMSLTGWFSAMVPSATPRPIVDQINKMFNQVTATEDAKKFLNNVASDPVDHHARRGAGDFCSRRSRTGATTSASPRSNRRGDAGADVRNARSI